MQKTNIASLKHQNATLTRQLFDLKHNLETTFAKKLSRISSHRSIRNSYQPAPTLEWRKTECEQSNSRSPIKRLIERLPPDQFEKTYREPLRKCKAGQMLTRQNSIRKNSLETKKSPLSNIA